MPKEKTAETDALGAVLDDTIEKLERRATADEEEEDLDFEDEEEEDERPTFNPYIDPVAPQPRPHFQRHLGLNRFEENLVEVPFWKDYHRVKDTVERLKIERRTVDGVWEFIGYVHPKASEETVIAKAGKDGTYKLTGIDAAGRKVAEEYIFHVAPDNDTLAKLATRGSSGGASAGLGFTDPMDLMSKIDEIAAKRVEEAKALRAELDAERDAIRQEREKVERAKAALVAKGATEAISMVKEARNEESKRYEQRTKEEQAAWERKRQEERDYWKRRDDEDRRRREDEAKRQEAAAQAEAERQRAFFEGMNKQTTTFMETMLTHIETTTKEREADRKEHAKVMEEIRTQEARDRARRDKEHIQLVLDHLQKEKEDTDLAGQAVKFLEKISPIAGMLGVDLKDITSKLTGGNQTIPEMITSTVQELIKARVEVMKLEVAGGVRLDDGEADPEQIAEVLGMLQERGLLPQAAIQAAQQAVSGEQPQAEPVDAGPAGAGTVAGAGGQAQPQIPRGVLRKARATLAAMVNECAVVEQSKWMPIIASKLKDATVRAAVLDYFRAIGVRPALTEAGATSEQSAAVLNQLETTGLLPADIPRFTP